MNYAEQIIDTIQKSAVTRMLLVDDAYDPPTLSQEWAGQFLEMLEHAKFRDHIPPETLADEVVESAVIAINESEYADESVTASLKTVYARFIETRAPEFDPDGQFNSIKGATLSVLDPLVEMLQKGNSDVSVKMAGTEEAVDICRDFEPDLIFMDFFLSPGNRTDPVPTKAQEQADREQSINLLKSMLIAHQGDKPAVVLMSSQDVKKRTEKYRARLEGRVMALRFGYLHKNWVSGAGDNLSANGDAADVLIETSGSLAFGRALEAAFGDWRVGAKAALDKLEDELSEFDIKDFAYLMRFRLYDEGEPFADYMEWFLGESLRALVDEEVEWKADHFERLDDEELTSAIEGAHPLPSDKIARFFDRMRFNGHGHRERKRFALGDVFISPDAKLIRMVISPDCDLVPRNGKTAATRLLTVGGVVKGLDQEGSFVGELLFLNKPKAIKWSYKDLMTHQFDEAGEVESLRVDDEDYKFKARMRPLAAQAVQKAALADLSRVGVAVPPTVHTGAQVSSWLKILDGNQAKAIELDGLPSSVVQIIMPRGGNDSQKRILFAPAYVRALVAILREKSVDDFAQDYKENFTQLQASIADFERMMLRDGLPIPGRANKFGITTNLKKPSKKFWLEFICDLSDEALLEIEGDSLLD